MSQKSHLVIPGIVLVAAAIFSASLAGGQAATLQDQLVKEYKLVKMGSDTGGYSVVEEGTVLAIQKGGILAVPYSDNTDFKSKYENGEIKAPSGLAVGGRKLALGHFGKQQTTHLFAKGDKVYPTKIDVNLAKDSVTLGIVACDTCNKTDPPTYNKAEVVFQFPKGSLANANQASIDKVIAEVFTPSKDDSKDDKGGNKGGQQQGAQGQGGQDQGQQGAQDQGQQGGDQQQQAEPVSIEKGMTPDQVIDAMGQPEKKVTLGVKQIYYYKDMKVIFMNGKVSDVQ
jgi:hypothetical protein